MNQIFVTARRIADKLKQPGRRVEYSEHPTSWGNSAYVYCRTFGNGFWIERGFRLSDHEVGDRRKETDGIQTVIYGDAISDDFLTSLCIVSDEEMAKHNAKVEKKRRKMQASAKADEEAKKEKIAAGRAQADYQEQMLAARNEWIQINHPEFDALTKTKQRPIIKRFNKIYREEKPQ